MSAGHLSGPGSGVGPAVGTSDVAFPHGPQCLGEGTRPHHAVPECLPWARPCSKQQGTQWEQTRSRPAGSCSTLCSVTPGTTEGSPGCCGRVEGPPGPTQPRAVREGCPEPSLPRESRGSRLHEDGIGGAKEDNATQWEGSSRVQGVQGRKVPRSLLQALGKPRR